MYNHASTSSFLDCSTSLNAHNDAYRVVPLNGAVARGILILSFLSLKNKLINRIQRGKMETYPMNLRHNPKSSINTTFNSSVPSLPTAKLPKNTIIENKMVRKDFLT